MIRREITDIEKEQIVKLYRDDKVAINKIGELLKLGKIRIKEVLSEYNIESNKVNIAKIANKNYKNKFQGDFYEITCKTSNEKFYTKGDSTCRLTTHLNKIHPEISIPNNFERKKFYLLNGFTWHEQYFSYLEITKPETIKCKYCKWETEDIKNTSGAYPNHINNSHNITIEEHLLNYPDELLYFNTFKIKKEKKLFLLEPENSITCLECGKVLKSINHRHLRVAHNMSMEQYRLKHNVSSLCSDTVKIKQIEQWNKSLKNNAYTFVSKAEKDIKDFIETFSNEPILTSDRNILDGLEIDIILEKQKLGIEYNGNLWHSEKFGKKDSKFHLNKTVLANNAGYNLIQIFEDEWHTNKDLVKNKIKHILGFSSGIRVGGRQCVIKEINKSISKCFLDKYHIQGGVGGDINLGAYFNDILIAVMCFNKKRNMTKSNKQYEYDLIRFSTDYNYIIQGIGSKLFKFFIKNYNPVSVISFADRRWSFLNSNIYEKLKFKNDGYVLPNYWYYNPSISRYKRYHKFGFGLNSLKRKNMYIEGKTEWECMQHHGWDRIWDCGLIRYVWEK